MFRVVHVAPYNGIGGAELAARSMATGFNDNIEFEIDFIFKNVVNGKGIWATFNPLPIFASAWRSSRCETDLLIVSLWRSTIVGLLAKFLRPKLKLVVFLHSSKDVHLLDFIFTRLAVILAAEVWADSLTTLTGRIPGLRPEKCRVISFVTRRFAPPPARPVSPSFIYWGRIDQEKGLDRAIRLFAQIKKRRPAAGFLIVGPDRGALHSARELCASLGLKEAVHFTGAATHEEIISHARPASFYLQTSIFEGMAMSVVESMQMGLVPVVTPVGEIAAYCQDGKNAVVIRSDEQAVSDVVDLLNADEKYQILRENAVNTWAHQPLYRDSILSACAHLLRT